VNSLVILQRNGRKLGRKKLNWLRNNDKLGDELALRGGRES